MSGCYNSKSRINSTDFFSTLPYDIVLDILTRLSTETLSQCKFVCRSWLEIIQSPEFVEYLNARTDSARPEKLAKQSKSRREELMAESSALRQKSAQEFQALRDKIAQDYQARRQQIAQDYQARRQQIAQDYQARRQKIAQDYQARRQKIAQDYQARSENIGQSLREELVAEARDEKLAQARPGKKLVLELSCHETSSETDQRQLQIKLDGHVHSFPTAILSSFSFTIDL
ncbi:uncharacterized protein LOC119988678 isoform X1 [Tripterygium wilfordii]|uniref:uncharacterized protein LOC119988678 isoform X1 n=1 Tax=Tripterygium wilfordii TaxID=458696 RepID=UPI0018F7E525|nr:uncharacterized protein LOC119988678 isoform X1 [Tripterygium wilfordii]